jgi:hypothetical protein
MFTDSTSNLFSLALRLLINNTCELKFLGILLGFLSSITLKYVPKTSLPVFLFIVFYCSSGFEEKNICPGERAGIKCTYYAPAFPGFNIMPDIYKCCLSYSKNTEILLNISTENV